MAPTALKTRTAGRVDSTPLCEWCNKEVEAWHSGRHAPYCSAACQQRGERAEQAERQNKRTS